MDGLKKIALIKSAKFDFNEIDLDGNNLFIGANGAGKTTLLRAILYFYTADARSLGINSTKKISFNDYYFEYQHSYLIYMYKKDDQYILTIIYKDSNIKFRLCLFNEIPNIKDIFIIKDKPIEHSKLWIKLREQGILSNILSANEYRKTIYSKNNKLQHFSLFEAKEYDGFVKTLSNIFINNKVDSSAIKKVLVSSLDVNKNIDIEQIKRYLEKFNTSYEDIQHYTKQQPNIVKLLSTLNQYEQIKNDLQENFSTLCNSKSITKAKIKTLDSEQTKLKDQESDIKEEQLKQKNLFSKREKKFNETIGVLKDKVKKANEKIDYYKTIDIDNKLMQYNNLNNLNEDLSSVLKHREFITTEYKELEATHQNHLQKIKNQSDHQKNSIENDILSLKNSKSNEILILNTKLNEDIQTINDSFAKKQNILKDKINQTKLDIQSVQHNISNAKKEIFVFEYKEKLEQSINNMLDLTEDIKKQKNNMTMQDNKLENYINIHTKELESIDQQEKYQLKDINIKITNIKKLITPNQDSLAAKLHKQNLNLDKYIHFVNEDILNSNVDVNIKSNNDQLFEVEFLDFEVPKNILEDKLNNYRIKKDEITKEFEKQKTNKQKELRNFENKIYRIKRNISEDIKEKSIKLNTSETLISNLKNKAKVSKEQFANEKIDKIKLLNTQNQHLLDEQNNTKEDEDKIRSYLNKEHNSLKIQNTKNINKLEKEYSEKITICNNDLEILENKLKQNTKIQIDNYQAKLKTKNIDTKKLEELDIKEKNLQRDIQRIKNYEDMINNYKYDTKEYISKLKETKTNLEEQKLLFNEVDKKYNILNDKAISELKNINDSFNQNEISLSKKQTDIEWVSDFEQSSSMAKAKNIGIKYIKNDSYEKIDTLLSNISNLFIEYTQKEKDINAFINKFNMIFNNSLNIKMELDFIDTAYSIKEFEQNNTISKYKDLLSTNLNQIIKSCIDEYNNLIVHSGKIELLVNKITKLFKEISIGVIDELKLKYSRSNNKVIEIFSAIKDINEQNSYGYEINLFNENKNSDEIINILKKLRDTIELDAVRSIDLEDSFVLEFRVIENGNDSKYQTSLDMIGSNGTDVLVKSMIYIAMLHIFKTKSTKKEIAINVILDEIGILSQRYLKELIEFANKYNIFFINGAPDEKLIGTYKRVSLVRNINNSSIVQEIISK